MQRCNEENVALREPGTCMSEAQEIIDEAQWRLPRFFFALNNCMRDEGEGFVAAGRHGAGRRCARRQAGF